MTEKKENMFFSINPYHIAYFDIIYHLKSCWCAKKQHKNEATSC